MVNGWRNGFPAFTGLPDAKRSAEDVAVTANGTLIFLMGFLFLFFGYLGVPVAFALIASVLVVTIFTPISLASMMAQLFNGMDTEALLAVPFFLLVGDLMTSANVTVRMIRAVADHGRPFARRPRPGGDAVQHVLRRHFRLVGGRRRGAHAHARAGDEPRRLRQGPSPPR